MREGHNPTAYMFSIDSYRDASQNGGVVKRLDRGVLAVSGADRAAWLQGLLTNDVEALNEGESRYAAYLTPQGRMISDMNVVARGERMLLDVPETLAASLREKLDALVFSEDVAITDERATQSVWTVVQGEALIDVIGDRLSPEYAGLHTLDMDTFEVLRVERGVPRFLVDMNEDTIPLEAGIEDRAISFTKGCYVGQEIIVRVTHRGGGRVAKKLVKWAAMDEATMTPPADAKIFSGSWTGLGSEKEIGRVTSAVLSPRANRIVGLCYVHRDFAAGGTDFTIAWNDTRIKAVVL